MLIRLARLPTQRGAWKTLISKQNSKSTKALLSSIEFKSHQGAGKNLCWKVKTLEKDDIKAMRTWTKIETTTAELSRTSFLICTGLTHTEVEAFKNWIPPSKNPSTYHKSTNSYLKVSSTLKWKVFHLLQLALPAGWWRASPLGTCGVHPLQEVGFHK